MSDDTKYHLVTSIAFVVFALGIVGAILVGHIVGRNQQLEFNRICSADNKTVVWREVGNITVSECK